MFDIYSSVFLFIYICTCMHARVFLNISEPSIVLQHQAWAEQNQGREREANGGDSIPSCGIIGSWVVVFKDLPLIYFR